MHLNKGNLSGRQVILAIRGEGGELVLHEIGLIFKIKNLLVLIFQSDKIEARTKVAINTSS